MPPHNARERKGGLITDIKRTTEAVIGAAIPGAVTQAIADRTPSSVATRNTYLVAGSSIVAGALAKAFGGRRSMWDVLGDGLLYGGVAIGAQPATQWVDSRIQRQAAPASTSTGTTAAQQLVRVQRVAAAPVYRAQADDLADSFDTIGL